MHRLWRIVLKRLLSIKLRVASIYSLLNMGACVGKRKHPKGKIWKLEEELRVAKINRRVLHRAIENLRLALPHEDRTPTAELNSQVSIIEHVERYIETVKRSVPPYSSGTSLSAYSSRRTSPGSNKNMFFNRIILKWRPNRFIRRAGTDAAVYYPFQRQQ